MKNKKLSIVVPNYNNEKYLEKCIECLLQQTYKNIEIIVVNDGSNVYFLDHGDAYDRGLILSSFSASSDGHIAQRSAVNIFPFMGPAGQN